MGGTEPATVTALEPGGYADAVLADLKPFQRRTAEYAFHRLYEAPDSTQRFLVADEVGLGKTLVAAGVTALAIDELRAAGTPRIDIIYICSNQAIARQNVERIKQRLSIETKAMAERITLLPYTLRTLDQRVNLVALTPGTSFSSSRAEGVVKERIILFRMLTGAWGNLGRSARQVFRGTLRTVRRFREYEAWIPPQPIDPGILQRFQSAAGGPDSPLHREFIGVRDGLAQHRTPETRAQRRAFIAKMRRILADACLDALEPDLVILDEFQRFRHLLDTDTESGELARQLFEYEDEHTTVRTMLLSATPYKMYTLSGEADDDHYRDFLRTVRFLEGPDGSVERLEDALRAFRDELPRAAAGGQDHTSTMARLSAQRDRVQSALQRVMSRTERRGRASVGDPMLEVTPMHVGLEVDDVETYLAARELADLVDAPDVTEYWKSSPYLLSFMEHYQLAERVRRRAEAAPDGDVARLVGRHSGLQLRSEATTRRDAVPAGNGRMRALLDDLDASGLHRLLWLPPLLPAYTLGDDFERARTETKRLVFSSWAMVPRAIGVMASYDAERRHIPDRARAERYQAQLLNVTRSAYSVFALLAPSATLATVGDPLRYRAADADDLVRAIEDRLRPEVEELTRGAPGDGPPQEIWYAAAPLLLDRQHDGIVEWLHALSDGPTTEGGEHDDEPTAWRDLAARIRESLRDPATLGRPPRNLAEVLAALAAGSPANATLRALSRVTSQPVTDRGLQAAAVRAAWAFRALFHAPSSEGLLRNLYVPRVRGGEGEYWRRVLAYAVEGGLSEVLDEFFHVVREARGTDADAPELVDALVQALRLAVGRLDVAEWNRDGSGVRRETFSMRQHFARRYVSDALQSGEQQASEHLDAIRAAFNSPFWPFVLSTTSVGQEGLDFHWYCHAVVHWNLPPNPVDLEQREGRVHRYHGHAIRKNIAHAVGSEAIEHARAETRSGAHVSPWNESYRLADERFGRDDGLVPHWVFSEGTARIQRRTPVLPLSRDVAREDALRRSLAVYRMVFGQPRQDDLLEFIVREIPENRREAVAAAVTIDLSPPSTSGAAAPDVVDCRSAGLLSDDSPR